MQKNFSKIKLSFLFILLNIFIFKLSCFGQDNNNYPDFTNIVDKYSSAVVNISTSRIKSSSDDIFRLPPNLDGTPYGELLKKFFEDQYGYHDNPNSKHKNRTYQEPLSLGSGTLVSKDGYIVTNAHVVENSDKILVKLSDKRVFNAKVIGVDKGTDLALLKINAKNLPFVQLADSKNVKVGEWVLAIGSPFGFEYSATQGIVSGIGRSIGRERYVPFIQTDAAVNPGNSGGPLFNLKGQVIGINAQILSKTGGYLGLSFAIPSNIVSNIVGQIRENGYVARGWLGIGFQALDEDLAKSFGLDRVSGALVVNIVPDSPADKAGIKTGDVILKFGNNTILDPQRLPSVVGNLNPGTSVNIEIFRDGKIKNITMVIGKLESEEVAKANSFQNKEDTKDIKYDKLGLKTRDLNDDERKALNVDKGGVIIIDLEDSGIASNMGLDVNQAILTLNMQNINNLDDYKKIVKSLPADKWIPILVTAGGENKRYFAFKITK